MPKLVITGAEVIAAITLIGCFALRLGGYNSNLDYLIGAIALIFLGIDIPLRVRKGR